MVELLAVGPEANEATGLFWETVALGLPAGEHP